MTKIFEIFYSNLNEQAQLSICSILETTHQKENWDIQPLAVLKREVEKNGAKPKNN